VRTEACCRWLAATLSVWLFAVLAGGCHVQTRVVLPGNSPPAAAAAPVVKAGDDVVLVLRDGTRAGLVVAAVQTDVIVGTRGQRYPVADIVEIERRRLSIGRSTGLAAGLFAAVYAAFILLMLAAGWQLA
jgi:hypothetical protein